jgi:pyruvate ferredoxin oxidoreductase alpha subunit
MFEQIEGSLAEVISCYPITPQTHIVETLSQLVKKGEIKPCEFLNVESEFAAMSVLIGASAAGARTYTATSSQGLLFMAEALFNASGLGLPIVMTDGNRAIGAPTRCRCATAAGFSFTRNRIRKQSICTSRRIASPSNSACR